MRRGCGAGGEIWRCDVVNLTPEDHAALSAAIAAGYYDHTAVEKVAIVVEQIVARHVAEARAAALNEAGDALQARVNEAVRVGGPIDLLHDDIVQADRNGWLQGIQTAVDLLRYRRRPQTLPPSKPE